MTCSWILALLQTKIIGGSLTVFWTFFTVTIGPLFYSLFESLYWGRPWLEACFVNSFILTFVLVIFPRTRMAVILFIGGTLGIANGYRFRTGFLNFMLEEQQNCDSICLGLNRVLLGAPYWHFLVGAFFLAGFAQGYYVARKQLTLIRKEID
jgi:hypothetical protein